MLRRTGTKSICMKSSSTAFHLYTIDIALRLLHQSFKYRPYSGLITPKDLATIYNSIFNMLLFFIKKLPTVSLYIFYNASAIGKQYKQSYLDRYKSS